MLQTVSEKQRELKLQQELQIKALEHLIDEDFDSQNSCHAVCLLLSQMYAGSDDKINQLIAELAKKALESTVEITVN